MTSPPDDRLAATLRGFGPVGILAMLTILAGNLVFIPLSALLVLIWAARSGTPWADLGFTRPASWIRTVAGGVALGVALKLVMKALVMPLLGAPALNQAYQHLVGNTAALPGMLLVVTVGAGFGEETVFRGYLFERFGKLLGSGQGPRGLIIVLTSVLFGLAHLVEQGVPGAQQGMIVGLVFGTIFAATRRIWMLMVAHAAFDITAVAIIYWNLESTVAQLVFD